MTKKIDSDYQLNFIVHENGIAVVSIGTYEDSKFIGMNKEELRRFANRVLKALDNDK